MVNPLPHCVSRKIPKGAVGCGGDNDCPGEGGLNHSTISDRDGSDWDRYEPHPSALQCASKRGSQTNGADLQESQVRDIFRRKPAVKRVLCGGKFWTDRYHVTTVGEQANWEMVKRYVPRQGQPQEDLRQLRML